MLEMLLVGGEGSVAADFFKKAETRGEPDARAEGQKGFLYRKLGGEESRVQGETHAFSKMNFPSLYRWLTSYALSCRKSRFESVSWLVFPSSESAEP
jgi:hypothetical protein